MGGRDKAPRPRVVGQAQPGVHEPLRPARQSRSEGVGGPASHDRPHTGRDFGDEVHQVRVGPDFHRAAGDLLLADKALDAVHVIVVEVGVDHRPDRLTRESLGDIGRGLAGAVFLRQAVDQNQALRRLDDRHIGDVVADQGVGALTGLDDLAGEAGRVLGKGRVDGGCGFDLGHGSAQLHGSGDAEGVDAAVDLELAALDPAALVGGEEQHQIGDFIG